MRTGCWILEHWRLEIPLSLLEWIHLVSTHAWLIFSRCYGSLLPWKSSRAWVTALFGCKVGCRSADWDCQMGKHPDLQQHLYLREERHWRISRAAVLEEGYHSFQVTELNGFSIPRFICLWWKLNGND